MNKATVLKASRKLCDALDAQAKQAHERGDFDEWRRLTQQGVGAVRLERRLIRNLSN